MLEIKTSYLHAEKLLGQAQGSGSRISPNTSLSILYGGQGSIKKPSDKPEEWVLKETKGDGQSRDPEASHAARCLHLTIVKELDSQGVWRHEPPDQQGAQIRGKTWKVWA